MSEAAKPVQAWPTGVEYSRAVQEGGERLGASYRYVEGLLGSPQTAHGRHAIVFRFDHDDEPSVALRCFTQAHPEAQRRYQAFDEHLRRHPVSAFPEVRWLDEAIDVNGETWPGLQMEWIEGLRLDRWIDERIANDDSEAIGRLADQWREVARDVAAAGVGHGDYQHGNVLVDAAGELRLVDLDGLWVPELADEPSDECGHESYQHPERAEGGVWSSEVDGFAALLIWLSLKALAADPELWADHHPHDEHLVLGDEALADLAAPCWNRLAESSDAEIRALAERLRSMLRAPIDEIPGVEAALCDADIALDLPVALGPAGGSRTTDGAPSMHREIDVPSRPVLPAWWRAKTRVVSAAAVMFLLVFGLASAGNVGDETAASATAVPRGGATEVSGADIPSAPVGEEEPGPQEKTTESGEPEIPTGATPTDELPSHLESPPIEEQEDNRPGSLPVEVTPVESSPEAPPADPPQSVAPPVAPPADPVAPPRPPQSPSTTTTSTTAPPLPALRAVIAAPSFSLDVGESVTFDGRGSSGSPDSYLWDWGYAGRTTTGPTAGYAWPEAGTFTVTLTVTRGAEAHTTTVAVVVAAAGVVVPNVVGIGWGDAEDALEALGLEPWAQPQRSTEPRYKVLSQGTAPGATVAPGSRVTFYVSDTQYCDENPEWASC